MGPLDRALKVTIVAAAIAIVQGCAAQQPSPSKPAPGVAAAAPSATPTPSGAALDVYKRQRLRSVRNWCAHLVSRAR